MPPKSHTTVSPGPMRRSPASWWGLAEFGPLPTMAKFTWCVPLCDAGAGRSHRRPPPRVRPTRRYLSADQRVGDPVGGGTGGTERGDLHLVLHGTERPVTSEATPKSPAESPAAARAGARPRAVGHGESARAPPTRAATSATGSSRLRPRSEREAAGRRRARGAPLVPARRASRAPLDGRTSTVGRSRGIAS